VLTRLTKYLDKSPQLVYCYLYEWNAYVAFLLFDYEYEEA
jgi:hypothetical protein